MSGLVGGARRALGMVLRTPDAPARTVRDPWPGLPERGVKLLKGELDCEGVMIPLQPGVWGAGDTAPVLRAAALGFAWLRDLRALGSDAARMRARAMVGDFLAQPSADPLAMRPDVVGGRIGAWLGQYDFFAATADEAYRARMMARIVADARALAASLPAEAEDGRALVALKGLLAAALALPEQTALLTRFLRFLPQEIGRQFLADGMHVERSPAAHVAALLELIEMRGLLQALPLAPPTALTAAIERAAQALRLLRHGDGGLALFNGTREQSAGLIELVLAQASKVSRPLLVLPEGRFHRLAAGKTVVLVECGAPAPRGADRTAAAGMLSFELSCGKERLIVNCGAPPPGNRAWAEALRSTAAHSTLVIADTNSAEVLADGIGRRPQSVTVKRTDANGAQSLEMTHNGYADPFKAIHRRMLTLAPGGTELRGEDAVLAGRTYSFCVRFHLHPSVTASLQQDGESVLLLLPSGAGWRLTALGCAPAIEESVYWGGGVMRRCEQVCLTLHADGPQKVEWVLSRLA